MTRGSARQRRKLGDLADVVRCVEADRESDVAGEAIAAEPEQVVQHGQEQTVGGLTADEIASVLRRLDEVSKVAAEAKIAATAARISTSAIIAYTKGLAKDNENALAKAETASERVDLVAGDVDLRLGKLRADMAAEDARARFKAQDAVSVSFAAIALAVVCAIACVAMKVM